jgi:transketolase
MGHPKRGGAILASTGSLGHGFPMAVGLALAKKLKGDEGKVYCLVGDGECNEGTIWESALIASHHKLDNLVVIVDYNKSGERAVSVGSLSEKFHAFGFSTWDIYGHSTKDMDLAFATQTEKPLCIVASCVKGKGVGFMQNNPEWHNKKLTKEDYEKAIEG